MNQSSVIMSEAEHVCCIFGY